MVINAVIVTYNRKKMLVRCVRALLAQSISLRSIFIIDNASTDGTRAELLEQCIIKESNDKYTYRVKSTDINYYRLDENIGGAGGFHEGIKVADCDGADFIWIMDDDGYPSERCLEKQLEHTSRFDYIMPISLDTDKEDKLTWFIKDKQKQWTRSYSQLRSSFKNGIMNHAVPFNGLLMSRKVIEKVGLPKKEMFIWGDDFEHQYRCHKAGFHTVTALDAIFYHPEDKADHHKIFFNTIPVNYTESKLRFTCLIRNSTYNYWHYKGKHFIVAKLLIYTWFFLIRKKFAFREYLYYLSCVMDGIKGDFERHKQYLM